LIARRLTELKTVTFLRVLKLW